jgi:hypothetical protein
MQRLKRLLIERRGLVAARAVLLKAMDKKDI